MMIALPFSTSVLPAIGLSVLFILLLPLVLAAAIILTAMFLLAVLDVENLDMAIEKALREVVFVLASMI